MINVTAALMPLLFGWQNIGCHPQSEDDMTKSAEKEAVVEKPKTCFVMMPISDVDGYEPGHFKEVYEQIIEPAVTAAGYKCELATTTNSAHMIQLDIVHRVATADLCICDLSTSNANVLFEYGIRQAFDKPTVLIKDDRTKSLFDISGFRYVPYRHDLRIAEAKQAVSAITAAINDTLAAVGSDQVFSLVKLMQLSKASMPNTNISQEDARFELMSGKINLILQHLERSESHSRVVKALTERPATVFGTISASQADLTSRHRVFEAVEPINQLTAWTAEELHKPIK